MLVGSGTGHLGSWTWAIQPPLQLATHQQEAAAWLCYSSTHLELHVAGAAAQAVQQVL